MWAPSDDQRTQITQASFELAAGEILFAPTLTGTALTARYSDGARITPQSSDGEIPPATDLLFRINPEGILIPVTTSRPSTPSQATPSSSWARAEKDRRHNGLRPHPRGSSYPSPE